MNTINLFIAITVITVITLIPASAHAAERILIRSNNPMADHNNKFIFREHVSPSSFIFLLKSAHLDANQRDQMRIIMENTRMKVISQIHELSSIRKKISNMLVSPGVLSLADLLPLEQKEAKILTAMNKNAILTALAIRNILTPTQLKQVAKTHKKLEELNRQIKQLIGPAGPDIGHPIQEGGMSVIQK